MVDIVISTLLCICTLGLGYLGMYPPATNEGRDAYKLKFVIVGLFSLGLIVWQGIRTNESQQEAKQAQEKLQLAFEAEQKEANASRNDLNVARNELKGLRSETEKLRSDLAIESARRDQAQKDMALIVQKAGTETRIGVAEDLRKSPIKVDVPLAKEALKLSGNMSQLTSGEQAPFETKFILTVNQIVTPVRLLVQCEQEIVDAHGSLIGVGASMSGGWGGRFTKNQFGIGILSPAWTEKNPMQVTIKSNTKPLGACGFTLQ